MALLGKKYKYRQLKIFDNVIESVVKERNPLILSEKWDDSYFSINQDLILEVGCGRGAFTLALARQIPDRNFIGLDIKGSRIYTGAVTAKREKLDNVLFLRMQAEFLNTFFPAQSVSEIWITFPDPHLKSKSKSPSKRLTSPDFLAKYRYILNDQGKLHLKTDNDILFDYTIHVIHEQGGSIMISERDLYSSDILNDALTHKTEYEERFLIENKKIGYIQFSL